MRRLSFNVFWFSFVLLLVSIQPTAAVWQISNASNVELKFQSHHWPVATKPTSEIFLDHKDFQISYNQVHFLANWVFYRLSSKKLQVQNAIRRDNFISDPILMEMEVPYLDSKAYKGSKFDRGHMAPSADFLWDQVVNDTTFVMSNMAPQAARLNRFAWNYLEQRIRKWACTEKELQIVVGPVVESGLKKLPSGVSVPDRFFKVVLDETPPRKAIGFIYYQDDFKDVYQQRAVTVDEVEVLTGFDIFPDLDPYEQKEIEAAFDLRDWFEGQCK